MWQRKAIHLMIARKQREREREREERTMVPICPPRALPQ
jgi:hypothetical protein